GEPLNSFTRLPSATFHTLISPFQLPPAMSVPSGLAATAYAQSVSPLSVRTAPPSRFHSRTVLSALHVASSDALGMRMSRTAPPPCPPEAAICLPSPVAFQRRNWLSAPTE